MFLQQSSPSTRSRFLSLLPDELAFRVVNLINERAVVRQRTASPLFVPSTDLIGQRLFSTGVFERTQIEAIEAILEMPSLLVEDPFVFDGFVDVGANIGVYSIRFASRFKKTIAVEANSSTYHALVANLKAAELNNVSSVCAGASDREGELELIVPQGSPGWASIHGAHNPTGCPKSQIQVRRLDEIIDEIDPFLKISLLKVDVEGHEAQVLRGTKLHLERDKPIVPYEKLPGADRQCATILREAGYSRFVSFSREFSPRSIMAGMPIKINEVDPENTKSYQLICAF